MSRHPLFKRSLSLAGLAAAVFGLSLVSAPVQAGQVQSYNIPGVGEIVVHPGHMRDRYTGAPIDTVTESRTVYTNDLDLNTRWGQHVLLRRVQRAATDACDSLNMRYVTIDSEGPGCYRDAVHGAMAQAEQMIGHPLYAWND